MNWDNEVGSWWNPFSWFGPKFVFKGKSYPTWEAARRAEQEAREDYLNRGISRTRRHVAQTEKFFQERDAGTYRKLAVIAQRRDPAAYASNPEAAIQALRAVDTRPDQRNTSSNGGHYIKYDSLGRAEICDK